MLGTSGVDYNSILQREMHDKIYINYRDVFFADGSVRNECIAAITASRLGQSHEWRGPVFAYGKLGSSMEPPACKDFDMNDFRHVSDFFRWYNYRPHVRSAGYDLSTNLLDPLLHAT
jgi:hypothetical protein